MGSRTESFRPLRRRVRLSPEERREQIAQEAVKLIAQYGSYGFSMQLLADAVHMSVPGINHYVSSREEVLSLVIETYYDAETGSYAPLPNVQSVIGTGDSSKTGEADADDKAVQALGTGHISMPAYMRSLVESNAKRPQMVALFMQLAIESADPDHPAHTFYRNRHRTILDSMMAIDWNLPEAYRDPERLHDLIVTAFFAIDGVQVQVMTNPNETMTDLWSRAERVLFPSPTWDDYR